MTDSQHRVKRGKPLPVDRSVETRWTPALVREGFTPVSTFFLDRYADLKWPLTSQEAMLVLHLMRFKWDERDPFPSFEVLAARMGASSSSVRNYARSLQQKGYLRKVRGSKRVTFDLQPLFTSLEKLRDRTLDGHSA